MVTASATKPAAPPARSTAAVLFGIDVRSLAAFRIGLGVLLLADLLVRVQDLEAHYTRLGVLPAAVYRERWAMAPHLSVHFLSDTLAFQAVLFGLAAIAAGALLVGYRTRLATIVSWFLLISLHGRNPYVLQGGDVMLRMLLFWGMFLPLGARWSVDRARAKTPPPQRVLGIPTAALLLQLCFVYWFTVVLKANSLWLEDHTALYYALQIDEAATDVARLFLRFPGLLGPLTVVVWWFEMLGPFLAWSPVWPVRLRCLALVLFVGMHAVFAVCFAIGLFSYIMILAWLPFVPAEVWDWLARLAERRRPGWARALRPGEGTARVSPIVNAVAASLFAYVVVWNVYSTDKPRFGQVFTPTIQRLGHVLRLDQSWSMFMWPYRDDGWWVVPGVLEDGSTVDLLRDAGPPTWERPTPPHRAYPNYRWRKYMRNLWDAREVDSRQHYLYYSNYLCRTWNRRHPPDRQVKTFDVHYVVEMTQPDFQPPPRNAVHLWPQDCTSWLAQLSGE